MNWKEILKPSKIKIIIFIVLFIVMFNVVRKVDMKIFPCKISPVLAPDMSVTPKDSICSFVPMIGIRRNYYPAAYVELFMILIIIPYLIACGIGPLFRKKPPQPI